MPAPTKTSVALAIAIGICVGLLGARYFEAVGGGIDHVTVLRTYAFWALVTAPTAYLGDILVRTILNYRFVQMTLARVQSSPRQN